jgi:hypothetical protein
MRHILVRKGFLFIRPRFVVVVVMYRLFFFFFLGASMRIYSQQLLGWGSIVIVYMFGLERWRGNAVSRTKLLWFWDEQTQLLLPILPWLFFDFVSVALHSDINQLRDSPRSRVRYGNPSSGNEAPCKQVLTMLQLECPKHRFSMPNCRVPPYLPLFELWPRSVPCFRSSTAFTQICGPCMHRTVQSQIQCTTTHGSQQLSFKYHPFLCALIDS